MPTLPRIMLVTTSEWEAAPAETYVLPDQKDHRLCRIDLSNEHPGLLDEDSCVEVLNTSKEYLIPHMDLVVGHPTQRQGALQVWCYKQNRMYVWRQRTA